MPSDEEESEPSLKERIFQFWVKGFLVGVVLTAFVSPWISLAVTEFYTPWAPTYSQPEIEVELEQLPDDRASPILSRNQINNSDDIEVYHLKIDNQADVAAQNLNVNLPLPGCIRAQDTQWNDRVGVEDYQMKNITEIQRVSGNWSAVRAMSCSVNIQIGGFGPNDVFHINFITTQEIQRCDLLLGAGSEAIYQMKYDWTSHGHRLSEGLTTHSFPSLQTEYTEFDREIRRHNTAEYRNGNTRIEFVGLKNDYAADSTSEMNQVIGQVEC